MDGFHVILFIPHNTNSTAVAERAQNKVKQCWLSLSFNVEVPDNGTLQFSDLPPYFNCDEHLCSEYMSRSKKAILPFYSSHTKLVKDGRASLWLKSSLTKSRVHRVGHSLDLQLYRMRASGYASSVLVAVGSTLLKKLQVFPNATPRQMPNKYVLIPYIHTISHNLKGIGQKHGVDLVFRAPLKRSRFCTLSNSQ